jgi:hypothetical protein
MAARAAVIVGVDKTGGLKALNAAVSGAQDVAAWLSAEGFSVDCLVDTDKPVTAKDVKEAVKKRVDGPALDQLVLYFAGHGYLNGTAEVWLLSDAPDDPNEAIDQTISAEFARSCPIPSVVFISDACRTIPPTLPAGRVMGQSAFPNRSDNGVDVEVDRFFAAKPGDPALEFSVDKARSSYVGLFTQTLREAHRNPDAGLILSIHSGGKDEFVVPYRRLKDVLPERVDEAAQRRSIALTQRPQLRLESGDRSYLAHAEFTLGEIAVLAPEDPDSGGAPAQGRVLRGGREFEFHTVRPRTPARPRFGARAHDDALALRANPGFRQVLRADATDHFETQAGIQVTGAQVAGVYAFDAAAEAEVLSIGVGDEQALIRLHGPQSDGLFGEPTSVLIQLAEGTGTVIAGLPGYIAAVAVDSGRFVNVSYVPSNNSPLWEGYAANRDDVEKQRAMAAVAARNGLLAVDREKARAFGDSIRRNKRFDPTLGLYAALAYADLGLRKDARSVFDYMAADLDAVLFDVALLAGVLTGQVDAARPRIGQRPVVPFCPMLSQTWSFLQPRGVELPPPVAEAGRRRLPALWTTFDSDGVEDLRHLAEMRRAP